MNQHEIIQMQIAEHDRDNAKGPDLNRPSECECKCGWSGTPKWCKTSSYTIATWCPKCKEEL